MISSYLGHTGVYVNINITFSKYVNLNMDSLLIIGPFLFLGFAINYLHK